MNRIIFYKAVRSEIRDFLPIEYKEAALVIHEAEIMGRKTAVFALEIEGAAKMPLLNMEPYLKQVGDGGNIQQTMIEMAVDYAKQIAKQRNLKQRVQMER